MYRYYSREGNVLGYYTKIHNSQIKYFLLLRYLLEVRNGNEPVWGLSLKIVIWRRILQPFSL